MRPNLFVLTILTVLSIPFSNSMAGLFTRDAPDALEKKLNWVTDPGNCYNLCGGYYRDWVHTYLDPRVKDGQDGYDISSDQTTWKLKGETTLSGHVRVRRLDQEIQSDSALLYPNQETGKTENIKVVGNLRLTEPGKLIVAEDGWLHVPDRSISLNRCVYRIALKENKVVEINHKKPEPVKERHLYQVTAQGSAEQAKQTKKGIFDLFQASYSTCPPAINSWQLKAQKIHLNNETGRGEAYHSFLFVKGMPVCYLPYFNFPIDQRRYSGFLLPAAGGDGTSGIKLSTPYYLNLAPNYDATITPTWMAKRGVMMEGLFRYLDRFGKGQAHAAFLPNDSAFKDFQARARTKYATSPSLRRLEGASDDRKAFSWQDDMRFSDHFSSRMKYNYVSDDNYMEDFSDNLLDATNDQLMKQGRLDYQGAHWDFLGNFQAYQTLHPVDRDIIKNQYGRMPQLKLVGDYADLPWGFDAGIETEYDHFLQSRTPGITPLPVTGDRINLSPNLNWPLTWPFAYLTPRVQAQIVKYKTQDNPVNNAKDRGIGIPAIDVDSGLNFERYFPLFKHDYRQTLEPRLYYLYVPYRDQDGLPIFDTTAQTFTYDSMFQYNRFSGVDRLGDANQVTGAVATRFYDADNGMERGDAGIGQILYFQNRRVNLCTSSSCGVRAIDRSTVSPVTGVINYHFTPTWTTTINAAWSTQVDDFVNESATVKYQPDNYHLVTLNYQWLKGNNQFPGLMENTNNNDLKQTDLAGIWRLNDRWSLMGRWNYNWSYGNIQAYYYGVAYETCCWAVRFINARTYLGNLNDTHDANNPHLEYRNVVYLQFALKGLGRLGEGGDPGSLLSQTMSTYVDQFGQDN